MFKFIEKLFKRPSDLEAFINSKNPTNPAEVEYWTRYYELRGF
jgi:hypothetical protein